MRMICRNSLAWALGIYGICGLAGCGEKQEPIVEKAPSELQYESGMKALKEGNRSLAKGSFDTAIRLNPSFAPATFALAELEVRSGNAPQAIERLESLKRAAPKTPHVSCRISAVKAGSGRFVYGFMAAKLAIADEPVCPLARTEYAVQIAASGDRQQALKLLDALHRENLRDNRVSLLMVELLARNGKPDAAWTQLDSMPEEPKIAFQVNYLRGWLMEKYGRQGKKDGVLAQKQVDAALAISPENGPANQEKGRLLLQSGDAKTAQKYLSKAASVSLPNYDLLMAMAETQARLKNPAAQKLMISASKFGKLVDELYAARQAFVKDVTNRNAILKLAPLEAAIGNGLDGQELLTELLKRNPNDPDALRFMTPDAPQGNAATLRSQKGK